MAASKKRKTDLVFEGAGLFRQRVVCSILSGKTIRIDRIRADEEQPGVTDAEASLLRLIDRLTNGTVIEINETGTQLRLVPGLLVGGVNIEHECPPSRSVGYYLEALAALCPFAKTASRIVLRGVTHDDADPSVDTFRAVTVRLLKRFGVDEGLELTVKRRGAAPGGGGEVVLTCPVVRQLTPVQLVDEGKFRRIRGLAFTVKVAPSIAARVVDAARGVLNHLLPDVFIYTDHAKGREAGSSPGYGCSLAAESTTGVVLSAEVVAVGATPAEDLGIQAARLLCDEVQQGGCVDSTHQDSPSYT